MPNPKIPTLMPQPEAAHLTHLVEGLDARGTPLSLPVVVEKPLTIYLNNRDIITAMTIGNHVKELAVGFLYNQNMLHSATEITSIDHDTDLDVVIVRTSNPTDYEAKLSKAIRTSGCAQGTIYADIMDRFSTITLPQKTHISASQLTNLSQKITATPSLYLKAGAIHSCILCTPDQPLIYVEDIGRHNAVDKIAGYMVLNNISGEDKIFYTTGRLTSEMVIKTVLMGIPILVSRSGFTAAGVSLAREANLTLIGRAKGARFVVLSAPERLIFDHPPPDQPTDNATNKGHNKTHSHISAQDRTSS